MNRIKANVNKKYPNGFKKIYLTCSTKALRGNKHHNPH
jgi:hypothetical protein